MPFELGVDYGCRLYGAAPLTDKRSLLLGARPFEYARALSDIAGMDLKYHHGKPLELVREVRNWFVETVGVRGALSASRLWYQFMTFMALFHEKRHAEGFTKKDLKMMPVPEFMHFAREWMCLNAPPRQTGGQSS